MTNNKIQGGFSLIEVMISFILIGVGALGLIQLHAYIEQKADFAQQSIQALGLAENKLEFFRTHSAVSSAMAVVNFDTDIVTGSETVSGGYTLSWTVPAATVSSSLKTIEMTVEWTDRHGAEKNIQLNTMISKFNEFTN